MMTITDNSQKGRRNLIRRPSTPYPAKPVSQRAEESNNMLSKFISVDHDVSIQGMLRLDDTDNILISRSELLRKYHDMILARLTAVDKSEVRIHVRPTLLNANLDQYLQYVQQGVQVVLWQDDPSIKLQQRDNLTVVRIRKPFTPTHEGFLLIKAPSSTRMLATWHEMNNKIIGVLVTNPRTVEKVSDRLDSIIQSATR